MTSICTIIIILVHVMHGLYMNISVLTKVCYSTCICICNVYVHVHIIKTYTGELCGIHVILHIHVLVSIVN